MEVPENGAEKNINEALDSREHFRGRRERSQQRLWCSRKCTKPPGASSLPKCDFHCRGVAKMKILTPTQGEDAKKKRASGSMGSWFLQMMPKLIVLLQRCCKSENIDSHAGWGRQKKTSATQHGNVILTDDARIDRFTAEVLQKWTCWFPRSVRTPKKNECHAAWEADSYKWCQNWSFHCRGVEKVKILIPTQCEDAKKTRAPRSMGTRFVT